MSAASDRRGFVLGLATLPLIGSAAARAAPALSANDVRLVAAADAYEGLQRRCDDHKAAHRGLPHDVQIAAEDEFDALICGFTPLEAEMAETPADTMVGVLAKARACQVQTLRDYPGEVALSLVDDVWRLFGGGAV